MSFHFAVKGARRKFLLGLVAAVPVMASVIMGISQAAPASASTQQQWISFQTDRCLDSDYNGDVYTLPCNGGNYQNWSVNYNSDGTANIVDAQTDRCLDSNYNGQIYTLPCNGGNYQNWHIYDISGSYANIVDAQTGLYLDGNYNGQSYTLPGNDGYFQGWY
jgi:hypothetical protein